MRENKYLCFAHVRNYFQGYLPKAKLRRFAASADVKCLGSKTLEFGKQCRDHYDRRK